MFVWHSKKDMSRNHKRVTHGSSRALCGRNSREVIAHLCVFMPNQAQQQAVPPCVIDSEGRRGRGGGRGGTWEERRSFWLWSGVTWLWQHSSLSTAEACHSCWCPAVFNHTWIRTLRHTHTHTQVRSHPCILKHTLFLACARTHRCPLSARLCSAHSLWPQCCRRYTSKTKWQDAPTQDAKITSVKSCT